MSENKRRMLLISSISAVLAIAVITAVILMVRASSPERKFSRQIDLGNSSLKEREYDQAVASFEAAIEIDPKKADAYLGLVDAYIGMEEYGELPDVYELASDNLKKSDLRELREYIADELESEIKKALKHDNNDLATEYMEILAEIDRDVAESITADLFGSAETPGNSETGEIQAVIDRLQNELTRGYKEGQLIPDFTFYDADGNVHSISEFQGKTVYINFFTTWCTYCYYELPDIQSVYDEYPDDATVILIDLAETPELGMQYAEQYDLTMPIYYTDDWEIDGLTIEAVPLSIIIDRYGVVMGNNLGMAEYQWMHDTVDAAVNVSR
ncbi:MAG: redoxin domain-containing protein [Lachnospiraceae bacterium]|nr:redoxin domain-containing protein [Lachnospiraceae bacterium]